METITLTRQSAPGGTWLATMSDPWVKELFGTDTLPTPFLATAPLYLIVEHLREMHTGGWYNVCPDIIFDGKVVD